MANTMCACTRCTAPLSFTKSREFLFSLLDRPMSASYAIVHIVNTVNEICFMKPQPLVISNCSHYCETMDLELYRSNVLVRKPNRKKNLHQIFLILAVFRRSMQRVVGPNFRGLAPGLHSSEETSQRWQAVGVTVPI